MVRLSLLFTSVVAAVFASVPVLAQGDACVAPCTSVATELQACGPENEQCICTNELIIEVSQCVSCLTDAGINVGEMPGFEGITGHAVMCQNLGVKVDPTLVAAATSSITDNSTELDEAPSGGTINAQSIPGAAGDDADKAGNGAAALNFSLGALVAGFALSVALQI